MRFILAIARFACATLLGLMALVVGWQVFARKVLGNPPFWSEETALLMMIWLGLIGAALVLYERGHLAVEVFFRKLPRKAQKVLSLFGDTLILGFSLFILIGGFRMVFLTLDQTMPALKLPVGLAEYLALPVGAILMLVFHIHNIIRRRDAH